jgi:hypothetical protein
MGWLERHTKVREVHTKASWVGLVNMRRDQLGKREGWRAKQGWGRRGGAGNSTKKAPLPSVPLLGGWGVLEAGFS